MFKVAVIFAIICVSLFINCDPIKRVVVHYPPDVSVEIHKGIAACTVPGDDVAAMIKIIHTSQYPDDGPFKRFIDCVARTNGYADADGKYIVDKVIALYPDKEKMTEIVNECNKITADNVDDVIYLRYKCFQSKSPYDSYF